MFQSYSGSPFVVDENNDARPTCLLCQLLLCLSAGQCAADDERCCADVCEVCVQNAARVLFLPPPMSVAKILSRLTDSTTDNMDIMNVVVIKSKDELVVPIILMFVFPYSYFM